MKFKTKARYKMTAKKVKGRGRTGLVTPATLKKKKIKIVSNKAMKRKKYKLAK